MRRIALLSLTTLLGGCGNTWWNPPFTTGFSPNMPIPTSVNMSRVAGRGVAVTPLKTEPGDIWPGPLPPPISLQELSRQSPNGATLGVPSTNARGNRGMNPLSGPLPAGTEGTAPSSGQTPQPPVDRRIIVPNGNGTSTVINPDGRIETIPTPK